MRLLFPLLLFFVFAHSLPAYARMYQWVDAESGNARLSGEPPAWYRSGERGPRVLVFENGRLVDDTAVIVSPEKRKALREAAFLEVDLRREQDAVKKLERAAMREARRREEAAGPPASASEAGPEQTDSAEDQDARKSASATPPTALDGGMVEQLKAIISNWDRQKGLEEKP